MTSTVPFLEQIQKITGFDAELGDGFIALFVPERQIVRVLGLLKERLDFEMLTDLVVVERPGYRKRFAVAVLVTNLVHHVTVSVQTEISSGAEMDSIALVYPASKKLEKTAEASFGLSFRRPV